MKKWITTYIFFVGFILFSISGMASCGPGNTVVKKNITSAGNKATATFFKLTLAGNHPGSHCPDEICSSVYHFHCAGCSQTSPLLAGDYTPDTFFIDAGNVSVAADTAVPNGYLLHLYPSHYFW
jgi:hypothetical protein